MHGHPLVASLALGAVSFGDFNVETFIQLGALTILGIYFLRVEPKNRSLERASRKEELAQIIQAIEKAHKDGKE